MVAEGGLFTGLLRSGLENVGEPASKALGDSGIRDAHFVCEFGQIRLSWNLEIPGFYGTFERNALFCCQNLSTCL